MKKEYLVMLISALFILAYVLDAVVNPLKLNLATPYHFFTIETINKYVFTSSSIAIKSVAIFLSVIIISGSIGLKNFVRGSAIFLISAFMQLYAVQDVATNSQVLPLEWSLSLTLSGIGLLFPAVIFIFFGFLKKLYSSVLGDDQEEKDDREKGFWKNEN